MKTKAAGHRREQIAPLLEQTSTRTVLILKEESDPRVWGGKRSSEYFPLLLDAQVEGGMLGEAVRAKGCLHG